MRQISTILPTLIFAFLFSTSYAQRKNEIALFYPGYEEFSFNPKIAETLNPTFANIRHRATKPDHPPWYSIYPRLVRPAAIGLTYQRHVNTNKSWRISWYVYYTNRAGIDHKPGMTLRLYQTSLSVDQSKVLWRSVNNKLTLSRYFQGTFRFGRDTYWLNYSGWVDIFPHRRLADLGLGVGVIGKWHVSKRINLSLDAGYTRWLFLYSNILDRDYYYQLKPWNQVDFRLSLGYAFGKVITPGNSPVARPQKE